MNTKHLLVMLIVMLLSACQPSAQATPDRATTVPTLAPTATAMMQLNPIDLFAGTWAGTMSFSNDPGSKADIVVTIPSGCLAGEICGDINNEANGCQWEMTLEAVNGDVFEYTFSKTLSGGDPCAAGVGTGGTLTLNSDGTLLREHKTPDSIASGILKRQ